MWRILDFLLYLNLCIISGAHSFNFSPWIIIWELCVVLADCVDRFYLPMNELSRFCVVKDATSNSIKLQQVQPTYWNKADL